jgi:hypothetical protein
MSLCIKLVDSRLRGNDENRKFHFCVGYSPVIPAKAGIHLG